MAKKKTRSNADAGGEEMLPVQPLQGKQRKRVLATGASGGHPCPGQSPSRKKKSLSQVASPSPNSKKRMQAAIAATRETRRPVKKSRGDVGVAVPTLTSRAFQHVLALDSVLRANEKARLNSVGTSQDSPSQVYAQTHNHSPCPATITEHHSCTGVQGSMPPSGVHVHIHLTPPEAPKQLRQDQNSSDTLVRARQVLEFAPGAALADVGGDGLDSDRVEVVPEPQICTVKLPNVEVPRIQTAAVEEIGGHLDGPALLPLPTGGRGSCQKLPNVTTEVAEVAVSKDIGAHPSVEEIEVQQSLLQTAPENALDSTKYGNELQQVALDPAPVNYSREFVDRLLSLLSPHEREAFLRTHPMNPPLNQVGGLIIQDHTAEFPNVEVPQASAAQCEGVQTCSPETEVILLSSTHSTDVQKENLVAEDRFQEMLRKLAQDERKYNRRQARKLAKKDKGKEPAEVTEQVAPGHLSGTPKPPLAPGRPLTSPLGPSNLRESHGRKHACLSSGGSSGTPPSSVAKKSGGEGDSTAAFSSWDTIQGIPPFEVNSLTAPTGEFWEHMRRFALEQAPFEFLWHLDWNKQCPVLKARFTLKLREVYPGPWDSKSILRAVGANLRERRTRLKRKFEKAKRSSQVRRPLGCSKGSWMIKYESTKDAKKQRKAKLCKEAANRRFEVQGPTHHCGSRGIRGLHDQFVDYFNRPPTNEELEYGKINGWVDLKDRIKKASTLLHVDEGKATNLQGSPASDPAPIDAVEDQVNVQSTFGTSNSDTSSTDGDTCSSESEEE